MLLRRVIRHVRKQEWTAVGIDFLIVVIGVLLAMQVSNWNTTVRTGNAAKSIPSVSRSELRL